MESHNTGRQHDGIDSLTPIQARERTGNIKKTGQKTENPVNPSKMTLDNHYNGLTEAM
jgi:hypothetical protein